MTDPLEDFRDLPADVARLRRHVEEQKRRSRRHAIAITLSAVGLACDIILSVVLYVFISDSNATQDCRSVHSAAFFHAEHDKVAGQVQGLLELRNAHGDQVKAMDGFNRFINASEHYLHVISRIPTDC